MSLHYVTALLEFQITEGVSDFKCLKFRLCDCLEEQFCFASTWFLLDIPKISLHTFSTDNAWQRYGISNSEGDVGGVRSKPQNRIELRISTTQNNIRKPQTALKLPENF